MAGRAPQQPPNNLTATARMAHTYLVGVCARLGLPHIGLVFGVAARLDRHPVTDQEGGVEAHTKLQKAKCRQRLSIDVARVGSPVQVLWR